MLWHDIYVYKAKEHITYITKFILPKNDCFKGRAMEKCREYCLRMNTLAGPKAVEEGRQLKSKLKAVPNLSAAKDN